jgi:hypothetical protein
MLKASSSHMRSSRNSQRPKRESKAEEKNRCEISSRRRQESLVVKGWTKKKAELGSDGRRSFGEIGWPASSVSLKRQSGRRGGGGVSRSR